MGIHPVLITGKTGKSVKTGHKTVVKTVKIGLVSGLDWPILPLLRPENDHFYLKCDKSIDRESFFVSHCQICVFMFFMFFHVFDVFHVF